MKLLTLLFLSLSIYSFAQWTPTNGPFGGSPYCMFYKNNTLFVGTECGIFVTSNNGEVWERRSNGLTDCKVIRTLVEYNNNLLVGTDNGVYVSTDDGFSWNSSSTGLTNLDIYSMYVNGQDILLSTQVGVFKSINGGLSWSSSSVGIPGSSGTVFEFVKSGSSLYAIHVLGVFKSNDNGFSWSLTNTGLPVSSGSNYYSLFNICALNSTLYVATNEGLYLSTNNGASWTLSSSNLPFGGLSLQAIGTALYAGVSGQGTYKSTNYGNSWNQISNFPRTRFLNANNILYTIGGAQNSAGESPAVLMKAITNETIWSNIGLGASGNANDVLKDGNNLYCATNNGFYFSDDLGSTWRLRNNGLNLNTAVNCITKHGSSLYIGTQKFGVYKSSDLGLNWVQVVNGLDEPFWTFHRIMSIESIGTELYIGALSIGSPSVAPQGRIFKSSNNGLGWSNTTNNINNGDNYVYVNDIHTIGSVIYLATNQGVFLSTNSGVSWVGSNFGMTVNQISAFTSNSTNLFAAQPGGVYVSNDYGSNWGNNNYWSNNSVYSLFAINNIVFGGSNYALISNDNGNTWVSSGNGLPVAPISAFHGDNSGVFAAMSSGNSYNPKRGVFKYGGLVGLDEILNSNSINVSPNPFTNHLEIKNISVNQTLKYEILDNSSRVIEKGEFVNNRIENLENLSNGIYYLKIIDRDKISLHKIIK